MFEPLVLNVQNNFKYRACRETYGDSAIGYVCLKRESSKCTVKARICPEHRVRSKSYSVTLIVDEEEEKVFSVECHDCAASLGIVSLFSEPKYRINVYYNLHAVFEKSLKLYFSRMKTMFLLYKRCSVMSYG